MLASGFLTNFPNSAKSSAIFCSSFKHSGNKDKILPAKEISLVSIKIFEEEVKALTIGKKD